MQSEILTLSAAGKTAAEIVATMQADSRHVQDVIAVSADDSPDLQGVLDHHLLLYSQPDGGWAGGLVDAVKASGNEELSVAFGRVLQRFRAVGQKVRTSESTVGSLATTLTQLAMQARPCLLYTSPSPRDRG